MGKRLLVDLPYRASTNKYPKFFPYPLLLLKLKQQDDDLLDLNHFCKDMAPQEVKGVLDDTLKIIGERQLIVSCGHFPADADKHDFFDYFLMHAPRCMVTGVYPSVMPERVKKIHPVHNLLPTDWDISDVDIPTDMIRRYPKVNGKLRASVRATHGCPRRCGMCPAWLIYRKQFSFWPIDKTVNRIVRYHDAGVRFITFIDDNLTVSPRFDQLLKQLIDTDLKGMKYICQEGFEVTSFHRNEMCELLTKIKFVDMKMAIENVSADVLHQIDKYYTDFQVVERALENIRRYGLDVGSYFLFGLEQNEDEVLRNIKFIADNALDVRINVVRPYEGSVVGDVNQAVFRQYSSLAYAASWWARQLNVNIMKPLAWKRLPGAGYKLTSTKTGYRLEGKVDHWHMTSRFTRGLKWMFSKELGDCRVTLGDRVATITKKTGGFGLGGSDAIFRT